MKIWLVGGDFARAGRSHNLVGWGGKSAAISSRSLQSSSGLLETFSTEISPVATLPIIAMMPALM